jgi:hypothetical protein
MTTNEVQIERTGDHVYLIRVSVDEEVVEVTLHVDPETVLRLTDESGDERRIVEETTDYLIRRQRPDDLPPSLDLADVAAAYGDWFDDMRAALRGSGDGTSSVPEARS